jgi:hypothetical protein
LACLASAEGFFIFWNLRKSGLSNRRKADKIEKSTDKGEKPFGSEIGAHPA